MGAPPNPVIDAYRAYRGGALADARRLCAAALTGDPGNADAHQLLANIHCQESDFAAACRHALAAVDAAPAEPSFLTTAAHVLLQAGRRDEARTLLERALDTAPDFAPARRQLAAMLEDAGDAAAAEAHYAAAVEWDPRDAASRNDHGRLLLQRDALDAAEAELRAALDLAPRSPEVHVNLGVLWRRRGRVRDALAALDQAKRLAPGNAAVRRNRGDLLRDLGAFDQALAEYDAALARDPALHEAARNRALALLLAGRFGEGFDAYERRWTDPALRQPQHPKPCWDGSDPAGRRLYLASEQGVGDMVMFAGMVPDLLAAGADLVLDADPRLVALFARSFPAAEVLARRQPPDPRVLTDDIDAWTPIGSLGRYLRRRESDFPRHAGYLKPCPQRVADFAAAFAALPGRRKIGIAWRSAGSGSSAARSLSLAADWAPLLRCPDTTFVSLQYGAVDDELAATKQALGIELYRPPGLDPTDDLDGLAAAIAALDLVIATTNVTVHLAGALGRPVWGLVPFEPSWRWLHGREDSPWYPSLRLFRQTDPLDWDAPLAAAAEALHR
jgi:tetratricopeptide (TPR) repeat protein